MSILSRLARASVRGALLLLVATPNCAMALSEFQQITASDVAQNDNFGYSVGISGNTAILGAWKGDRTGMLGDDSGSAYIFRDGGAGTWGQLDKLTASDADNGDNFGASVAIDGNTAAVGAIFKANQGGAYIFRDNGAGDWMQVDSLMANDGMIGDQFGYSIDISGNTAIVGAWESSGKRGSAYLFRDNGAGDWTQIAKLTANDAMPNDHFGISVAIDGTTALVGAYFNSMAAPLGGAVYVFEEAGGTWSQVDKLTASDPSINARFGNSVALNGNTALIGAPEDSEGGNRAGAAYVFQRDASMDFQEVDKLLADDAEENNLFGYSVALNDDAAVIGAYEDDDNGLASGSAYLFTEDAPGDWSQLDKLLPSDGAATDAFGWSVGISNGVALVGAPLNVVSGANDAGSAYLFNVPSGGLPGDYNRNGTVDAADYVLWRDMDGQSGSGLAADGNGDGMVDDEDYDLWRANFGLSTPPATAALQSSAVPEPATILSLLLALSFALTSGTDTFQRKTRRS